MNSETLVSNYSDCPLFCSKAKERAWNNLNNYGAGFLFLTKPSQEAHSWSTQRLRWFRQEQKDKPECSSYFMHVPKAETHSLQV